MAPSRTGSAPPCALPALVAGLLGAAFCLWAYGPTILDGGAIDWLMSGDRAQCFLGWHFYRHAHESLPVGRIPDLMSPIGSSLAFSDAMPWFSVALKPFSPWLPATFQIAGAWVVLSYVLLGGCAFLVLRELRTGTAVALAGSVLVVASPELARRGGHLSLCAQWLIVAGFLLALRTRGDRTIAGFVRAWIPLLLLASGTHPYLAAMVLMLAVAACANGTPLSRLGLSTSASANDASTWPLLLLARGAIVAGVTAAGMLLFGYLTGPPGTAGGFGFYSANLLALLDPDGASRLLPSLARGPGQYEGFAFVGTGTLLLLVIAMIARRRGRASAPFDRTTRASSANDTRELRLLALAVLAMAIFALGSSITLGPLEVASANRLYARLEPLPSVFRASGRFVWPLHFAVILGAVAWIARLLPRRGAFAAVVAAVALQIADGAAFYAGNDAAAQGARNRWNPLRSVAWRAAGAEFDEIRLVPPYFHERACPGSDQPPYFYVPFAWIAGTQGMRVNSGQLSRQPEAALAQACANAADELASGHVDPRVLYVLTGDAMDRFTAARIGLATCGRLDGFHVCWSSARRSRFASLVPVDVRPHGVCADVRQRWKPRAPRG